MKRFFRIAKKITILLLWIGGVLGFVVLTGASIDKQRSIACRQVHIQLDNDQGLFFVDEEDVIQFDALATDTAALFVQLSTWCLNEEKSERAQSYLAYFAYDACADGTLHRWILIRNSSEPWILFSNCR